MFRLKLLRNLRSVIWLILIAFIPLSIITIVWANSTGLPQSWRNAIEKEISEHGFHIKLDSLTYIPLRGFTATGVHVYAEKERINEISKLESVGFVFDYPSIATGKFRLRKIQLRNANLSLPVDPDDPTGDTITLNGLNGTIFKPNETTVQFKNTRANIGGIDISLSAYLTTPKVSPQSSNEVRKDENRRRQAFAKIIQELENWNFDPESPPHINIDVRGSLADADSIKAKFKINASSVEHKQYKIENLKATGELQGHLLTFSSISANDQRGKISGSIDYQLASRDGNFDVQSSIDIPRLLKSWFSSPLQVDILSGGTQNISFAGNYNLSDIQKPIVDLTGSAQFDSIMLRGVSFDSFTSSFSFQNGNLFLNDFILKRPDGVATGKLLKQEDTVRLKLNSSLPAATFKPFFKGQPLEQVIADFKAGNNATCQIALEGSFNLKDRFLWDYSGNGTITNTAYREVPLNSATCSFKVNHDELDFYNGNINFNYTDYPLRKAYNGPTSATAEIGRIRYEAKSRTLGIESIKGGFWPAPLVRMFAPNIANNIEAYRFHKPPILSGSGIVDVTPQGRTNLNIRFDTNDNATYNFLKKDVVLNKPSASVSIVGSQVNVSNLNAQTLEGSIKSSLSFRNPNTLSGEISWSKLSVRDISKTYNMNIEGGGTITGRLEFSLNNSNISTLSGKGLIALEGGELFSVPIFGPLSTVAGIVVNDKRFGSERAKDAFCSFKIKKGILSTNDFQTQTRSLKFTGNGSINLIDNTLDFTVHLNTRGLLGAVTILLKPFEGLFQFHGTGPLKKTTWKNVPFASPPPEQQEILLKSPPKAEIISE